MPMNADDEFMTYELAQMILANSYDLFTIGNHKLASIGITEVCEFLIRYEQELSK